MEVICERLDRQEENRDEVLESVAFMNTNDAVVMSQLCDVVNSWKELRKEVNEIKTCVSEKVCGLVTCGNKKKK